MLEGEIRQHIGPREGLSGLIRVGVSELVAMTWLPALAKTLHERYPRITLELDVSLTAPLRDRLHCGELDVVLIPGRSFDPGLVSNLLGEVQFCWMAGREFRPPPRPIVAKDFNDFRILSLGEQSYHFDTVSSWLIESGSTARRPDLCNSMTVLSILTAAGVGVSLLPPSCYEAELAEGKLQILDTRPLPPAISFFAVYEGRSMAVLQELISETAVEVSTFSRKPPLKGAF